MTVYEHYSVKRLREKESGVILGLWYTGFVTPAVVHRIASLKWTIYSSGWWGEPHPLLPLLGAWNPAPLYEVYFYYTKMI